MSLRVVEIRRDANGKQFMALQGQTNAEAREMEREWIEWRDKMAARIFREAFERSL